MSNFLTNELATHIYLNYLTVWDLFKKGSNPQVQSRSRLQEERSFRMTTAQVMKFHEFITYLFDAVFSLMLISISLEVMLIQVKRELSVMKY